MAIAPAPLGEVEFADSDLSESLESSGDEDEVAEVGDEHLVVGGVRWKKREGRQIDTLSTNLVYNDRPYTSSTPLRKRRS